MRCSQSSAVLVALLKTNSAARELTSTRHIDNASRTTRDDPRQHRFRPAAERRRLTRLPRDIHGTTDHVSRCWPALPRSRGRSQRVAHGVNSSFARSCCSSAHGLACAVGEQGSVTCSSQSSALSSATSHSRAAAEESVSPGAEAPDPFTEALPWAVARGRGAAGAEQRAVVVDPMTLTIQRREDVGQSESQRGEEAEVRHAASRLQRPRSLTSPNPSANARQIQSAQLCSRCHISAVDSSRDALSSAVKAKRSPEE